MSEPKTAWEQLQREARNCSMLRHTVTIAERDGDREGAMVAALIWFSRYYKKQIDREVEMLMNSPAVAPMRELRHALNALAGFERGED